MYLTHIPANERATTVLGTALIANERVQVTSPAIDARAHEHRGYTCSSLEQPVHATGNRNGACPAKRVKAIPNKAKVIIDGNLRQRTSPKRRNLLTRHIRPQSAHNGEKPRRLKSNHAQCLERVPWGIGHHFSQYP